MEMPRKEKAEEYMKTEVGTSTEQVKTKNKRITTEPVSFKQNIILVDQGTNPAIIEKPKHDETTESDIEENINDF